MKYTVQRCPHCSAPVNIGWGNVGKYCTRCKKPLKKKG